MREGLVMIRNNVEKLGKAGLPVAGGLGGLTLGDVHRSRCEV